MKKFIIVSVLITLAILAIILPASAAVTITNEAGEYLKLDVISGGSTTHTSIDSMTTSQYGGKGETSIIVFSKKNDKLCEGTFKDGEKLAIKKSGSTYSITKK
jgi:hypothetical protein